MKRVNCYTYTRVSTAMQVDGYSLDAQKEKLRKYAEFQEMHIVGEYSDEGKSGKNIANRPQFQQMLQDIESGKDDVSFVLVFKLSRFGRNAADVLSSLQFMQDYGVNLICVEDSIDSSRDSGKLMISVLSAVAEIERENILVQTMAGRKQKAKEGKWNGGFAPYGYYLEKGELKIAEDEAEVIRAIYDLYVHTTMGVSALAKHLNQNGYVKKQRQNGSLDMFSSHFVKFVLDNPIYCGKIAFGRRKTEKINGERNQYHVVKQKEYPLYDGIHEAIVSEELWRLAQEKRKENSGKWEKKYNLEHEHLLSGILCCPVCGAKMYGNVNRKRRPDGTIYKDHFYYSCKHRMKVDGHPCDYHRQWNQDVVNAAVEEVIHKAVNQPQFEAAVRERFNSEVDTGELENRLEDLRKQLRQQTGAKNRLSTQMDQLDVSDRHYERKYEDMEKRMDAFYDEIERIEEEIESVQHQITVIREQKITAENIYEFLYLYDIIYQKMTDSEKKRFLNIFLESVEIFPEKQPDGKILKSISFRFPIIYDGESATKISWDNKDHVEDVVVGGTIITWHALNQRGITAESFDYPEELMEFRGRKIWDTKLKDIKKETIPFFMKPVEDKLAPAIVVHSWEDLKPYVLLDPETEIHCSEVVEFISEWRCFLLYGRIIGLEYYYGEQNAACDYTVVENAVHAFPNMPAGFALDFGVTKDGRTLLIEANDGYSLGAYGLEATLYVRLLTARWAELNGTEDIFKSFKE